MKIAGKNIESILNNTSIFPKTNNNDRGHAHRGWNWSDELDLNKWLNDTLYAIRSSPDKRPASDPLDDPYRPSKKVLHIEKLPKLALDFNFVPPVRPMDDWSRSGGDRFHHYEFDNKPPPIKFEFTRPTPPPFVTVLDSSSFMLRVLGGALGGIVGFLILATLFRKSKGSRSGAVVGPAHYPVQPDIQTPTIPLQQAEPGPIDDDLPPPYHECVPSSINHFTSEEPPTYITYPKDVELHHNKQQQNAFVEHERRTNADAELVFDNGRVVERLSSDLSGTADEPGVAGDGNIQKENNKHEDFNDSVVYVDETDNVKVNSRK